MTPTDPLHHYITKVHTLTAAKERLQKSLDALDEDLADALQNYYQCVQQLDDAWAQLPEAQRVVLRAPERYY